MARPFGDRGTDCQKRYESPSHDRVAKSDDVDRLHATALRPLEDPMEVSAPKGNRARTPNRCQSKASGTRLTVPGARRVLWLVDRPSIVSSERKTDPQRSGRNLRGPHS